MFFPLYRNGVENAKKNGKILKMGINGEKMYVFSTNNLTLAVDRKIIF